MAPTGTTLPSFLNAEPTKHCVSPLPASLSRSGAVEVENEWSGSLVSLQPVLVDISFSEWLGILGAFLNLPRVYGGKAAKEVDCKPSSALLSQCHNTCRSLVRTSIDDSVCEKKKKKPTLVSEAIRPMANILDRGGAEGGGEPDVPSSNVSPLCPPEAALDEANNRDTESSLEREIVEFRNTACSRYLANQTALLASQAASANQDTNQSSCPTAPNQEALSAACHGRRFSATIVCASVRTALDLFLQASRFPPGSEILVGAINIPDVEFIIRQHGLVVIPLDLDVSSFCPDTKGVVPASSYVSDKSVAILVAHIFGRVFSMDQIFHFAELHRLPVIEDSAQAFLGWKYSGDPRAVISLFSFGTIKTQTALGGAIVDVRDATIYRRMKTLQRCYNTISTVRYMTKIAIALVASLLQSRWFLWIFLRLARLAKIDHQKLLVRLLRGFASDTPSLDKFRVRLSEGVMRVLRYRLQTWNQAAYDAQMQRLDAFCNLLEGVGVRIPGRGKDVLFRNYWLFPIISPASRSAEECCQRLNRVGIEAACKNCQLTCLKPSPGSKHPPPMAAEAFMKKVIFLPVHRRATDAQLAQVFNAVRSVYSELQPL